MMVERRRRHCAILLACCAVVAAACTGGPAPAPDTGPAPTATIAAFAAAWQTLKADPIAALTTDPGSAAVGVGSVIKNLGQARLTVTPGTATETDPLTTTSPATFRWTLAAGVVWQYTTHWTFTRATSTQQWKAQWSPTLINPALGAAQSVVLRTAPATDGAILDRDQQQILLPVTVYSVVARPEKIADLPATAAALAAILGRLDPSVTAASVVAGVKAATPAAGYTVTNLRQAEYLTVRSRLDALPGLSFPSRTRSLPPTKDFAKMLLAQVEPVAGKMVLGTPGWEIDSIDASGAELDTLASQPAKPGPNVTLTLDSAVQKAAEAALVHTPQAATLVAIQPSTGDILAVAQNRPANAAGPLALMGEYPPGSTFKIVTATAAFDRHLVTPDTPVGCPGEVVINSRTIHNEGFELGQVPLVTAFAKSCNTTFAYLASRMPDDALRVAATQYGIGRDFVIPGITTLTGRVPVAESIEQRAEDGFGQGVVLVTPFSEALMAATAANGGMPMPTLIRGTRTTVDAPVPPRTTATRTGIRALMRAVVTEGTGKVLLDAGTVSAKTGTADYLDTKGVDHAHAWTIGFRGDLAFSVLIVAGNTSRSTTAIADTFLRSLPAG